MRLIKAIKRTIHRLFSFDSNYTSRKKIRKKSKGQFVHINSINRLMLGMVNNERRRRHLHPVLFDSELEQHSIRWSRHMAHERKLSHSGSILENCCLVPNNGSSGKITKKMFQTWKKSSPHWNWMMDASISKAAFAYYVKGKYAYGAYSFG